MNSFQIGYATSPDGITWTDHPVNPVVRGQKSWESLGREGYAIFNGDVLFDGTRFHMWYTGGMGHRSQIGYATSVNGSSWDKADTHNPVLSFGPSDSWDSNRVTCGAVLFDGTTFHMWYAGNDGVNGGTGYATSVFETSIDEENSDSARPIAFFLYPNYPNPFNPETRISYEVAKLSRVRLSVLNLQGQYIRTLLDEEKPIGFYEVIWDGKDAYGQRIASGIYLYRLESKNVVQTRKMIFLK